MTAPAPVLGGSRVYCPYTHTERQSGSVSWTICTWRKRGRSARALRAYRRHWHRRHAHGA